MVRIYPPPVALADELERIAALAAGHAEAGERVSGVLAAEPGPGRVVFLCAFEADEKKRSWLALDAGGRPVEERVAVREAASIAALCEVAVETAGGGDLEELRAQLAALRLRENPPGIEEAEAAALSLERAIGAPPRLASPAYVDAVGGAARRLERALGDEGASPFAEAMKAAVGAVESLAGEVERGYKVPLR